MRPLNEVRNYMGSYQLKSGVYHYYRSEFKPAIGFLRKALADEGLTPSDRRNAEGFLTLALKGDAQRLADRGETQEGLERLEEAARMSPTFPDLHRLTGVLLERSGRIDEAIVAFGRAIENHPEYLDAHLALALCLVRAGRHEAAVEAFENAYKAKLQRLDVPFRAGMEHLGEGDTEAAMGRLHDVFLAAPRLAESHLHKALEALRAEDWDRALDELDRAIELNPNYPDLHNYRGIALSSLERHDEAEGAFRRSAELGPKHLVPRLNAAFAAFAAGRTDAGRDALESVLEDHPGDPVAEARLAELDAARSSDRRG